MSSTVPVSPWRAGLACRCPRCGRGGLFAGLLEVRRRCDACGFDLAGHEEGDGPAVFGIFILSAVLIGLALWVEFRFEPPVWVHVVLWPPVGFGLAILTLRVLKALLIALQYRHRPHDFDAA